MKPEPAMKYCALPPRSRQKGVTLMVALVLLLIVTLIALAAARTQTGEARLAANMTNRSTAIQSGEAALRYAEAQLLTAQYSPSSFAANTNGLYVLDNSVTTPEYLNSSVNWAPSSSSSSSGGSSSGSSGSGTSVITYSNATGSPSLSSDNLAASSTFMIEQLPAVAVPGESIGMVQYGSGVPPSNVYRITTVAEGRDSSSSVMLQSIFH